MSNASILNSIILSLILSSKCSFKIYILLNIQLMNESIQIYKY